MIRDGLRSYLLGRRRQKDVSPGGCVIIDSVQPQQPELACLLSKSAHARRQALLRLCNSLDLSMEGPG